MTMELDMIANLITKDFNQFGKKSNQSDVRGSDVHTVGQPVFHASQQNMNRTEFNSRPLTGGRLEGNVDSTSNDVLNHLLVTSTTSPHLNSAKVHTTYLQAPNNHHDQQLNNNISHEQFDVSNFLNMNINGHLHSVSLANNVPLGSNNGSLSGLPFSNGHHVVAAVASSSANPSGSTLLNHMQSANGGGALNARNQQQQQPPQPNDTGNGASRNGGTASTGAIRTRHRSSANDSMFKCGYCPKKFSDQTTLRVHMDECRIVRTHECPQCGKRFKARGGLQQHNRIHLQERPYHCHYCPKRFNQKSHLDQHERIHTGLKPFACQFCGRAFRQRSQQMGHEATHTNASSVIAASSGLSLHQIGQGGAPLSAATMVQPNNSLSDATAGLLQRSSDLSSLSSEQ